MSVGYKGIKNLNDSYILDKNRLENVQIFDEEYFDYLLNEIREIRASERKSTGENLLIGNGTISHNQTMDKT